VSRYQGGFDNQQVLRYAKNVEKLTLALSLESVVKLLEEQDIMAGRKPDGVIEAVRYSPQGNIELVRAYERRGFIFSDVVLLNRQALLEKLQNGLVFVTGQRTHYRANVFDTGKTLHLAGSGKSIITTKEQAGTQDFLANVPMF